MKRIYVFMMILLALYNVVTMADWIPFVALFFSPLCCLFHFIFLLVAFIFPVFFNERAVESGPDREWR